MRNLFSNEESIFVKKWSSDLKEHSFVQLSLILTLEFEHPLQYYQDFLIRNERENENWKNNSSSSEGIV